MMRWGWRVLLFSLFALGLGWLFWTAQMVQLANNLSPY
jgi:hypothetical protein